MTFHCYTYTVDAVYIICVVNKRLPDVVTIHNYLIFSVLLAKGIVIVFDLTRESSFEHVDSWIKSVRLVRGGVSRCASGTWWCVKVCE